MVIVATDYKEFHVTGVDTNGKRFKLTFTGNHAGAMIALSINLYHGSVWGVLFDNGKRRLLKRVYN